MAPAPAPAPSASGAPSNPTAPRLLAWYRRLVDALDRSVLVLCVLLLASVVTLSAVEIIGRSFFEASSVVVVDLALQLSILMYFLGYLVLLNRDEDISVDYFYQRFPRRLRRAIDVL